MAHGKARESELETGARVAANARTTYEITVKSASLPGLPQRLAVAPKPPATRDGKPAGGASSAFGGTSAGRSPEENLILNESLSILADYIRLLEHSAPTKPRGAG